MPHLPQLCIYMHTNVHLKAASADHLLEALGTSVSLKAHKYLKQTLREDKARNHRQHTSDGARGENAHCPTAIVVAVSKGGHFAFVGQFIRFHLPLCALLLSLGCVLFRLSLFSFVLCICICFIYLSKTFQLSRQQPTFVCPKPFWQRALCTHSVEHSGTVPQLSSAAGRVHERGSRRKDNIKRLKCLLFFRRFIVSC